MKKLILFILLFAYINTKAQDFNGINLDQTYTEVSNQLKKKGFKYVKKDQTYHVFNGELQYDPVKLGVEPLGSKIKSFAVLINPKNTWEDIEKDYYYYRKRLIEKYNIDLKYLSVIEGDARITIKELINEKMQFDCIYQDAFSPKKNTSPG